MDSVGWVTGNRDSFFGGDLISQGSYLNRPVIAVINYCTQIHVDSTGTRSKLF